MSNDFSPIEPSDGDAPMFAGVPSWERGKKRRGFGSRSARPAAEPRSFAPEYAPEPGDPIPTRPMTISEDARALEARMAAADTVDPVDAEDTAFAATPAFATRTAARRGSTAIPLAIAAGVILVGGLAAAGWYAYQPHNTGVAELTPGSPSSTTTTTQVASTVPAADQQVAQASPPPAASEPVAAATTHTVTTTTKARAPARSVSHTTVTRARPAGEASADASATAPTPAPAPVQAAPPPAPTPAPPTTQSLTPVTPQTIAPAPSEVPATPPTQTPQATTPQS